MHGPWEMLTRRSRKAETCGSRATPSHGRLSRKKTPHHASATSSGIAAPCRPPVPLLDDCAQRPGQVRNWGLRIEAVSRSPCTTGVPRRSQQRNNQHLPTMCDRCETSRKQRVGADLQGLGQLPTRLVPGSGRPATPRVPACLPPIRPETR